MTVSFNGKPKATAYSIRRSLRLAVKRGHAEFPTVIDSSVLSLRTARAFLLTGESSGTCFFVTAMTILELTVCIWAASAVGGFVGSLTGLGGGVVIIPLLT